MTLEHIEQLIKAIGQKHGTYCTFTVQSGHNEGGHRNYANAVQYNTYISNDLHGTQHQKFDSLACAVNRFERFLAVDDLVAYNKELAEESLFALREEKANTEEKIAALVEQIQEETP